MNNELNNIPHLNLPSFSPRIKINAGKRLIFDVLRKKFVKLTPEEWVRQHFVNYLLIYKQYPGGRIGNEISLLYNGMKKRCDTVIYDNVAQPLMLIEYKAPDVKITQAVFDQISVYNLTMRVPFLIVSNGMSHYCCTVNYAENTYFFLQDIPDYRQLMEGI